MNKEKLIKLLNLTSSSNDGEALSAIRKVNNYLADNNMRWEQFVDSFTHKDQIEMRKFVKDEYTITNMNLKKERAYSDDLNGRIRGYQNFIKYLFIAVIILAIGLIIK